MGNCCKMSLAERLYFTVLIPVTLVILITIMSYYTTTEISISSKLNSEMNLLKENSNNSLAGYEECNKKLEETIKEVEDEKKEINDGQKKKQELEDQLKKCNEDKTTSFYA